MTGMNGRVGVIAYPNQPPPQEALYYMVKHQITVQGVRANPNCSKTVLDMMSQGILDVDQMITHHFPLEEIHEAFDTFIQRKNGALKVVVHPNGEKEDL